MELKHNLSKITQQASNRARMRLHPLGCAASQVNINAYNPFIHVLHLLLKQVVKVAYFCLYRTIIAIMFICNSHFSDTLS